MRTLRATLVGSLLAVAATMPVRGESWEAYQPGSAGFSINMPAAFDRQDYGPDGSIAADAERGGVRYTVRYRPLQGGATDVNAVLDAARDESIGRAAGLRLGTQSKLMLDGAPARDLTLERADGSVAGLRRLVVAGAWLIEAAVDGPSGFEAAPAPRWFLNSLAMTNAGRFDGTPVRSYVVCFNGQPCGGRPCPATSALDIDAGQEVQGIYFDLDGLPAEARSQVSDDDMFKGRMVVVGRLTPGQVAENRGYPLLRVTAVVRQAQAAERRHCAVRD